MIVLTTFLSRGWLLLMFIAAAPPAFATEPVSTGYFNNVAVGGHDVAAYHELDKDDEAIKGQKSYTVKWKGASWQFLSEADSKKFEQNPERYAPAYNGHCANALSLGEGLISTNGKHWAIFDDQLFLFYAPRGSQRWKAGNWKDYKEEADRAWEMILSKK